MASKGSGIPRRALDDSIIAPNKLIDDLRNGYYVKEVFDYQPTFAGAAGLGDPTGLINTECYVNTKSVPMLGQYPSAETILTPLLAAGGLDVALDKGTGGAVQYRFGMGPDGVGKGRWFVQKNTGFRPVSVRASFNITTVAEIAQMVFGFASVTAWQNSVAGYDDFAGLDAQAGDVNLSSQEAGAGEVNTDTGEDLTDATDFEFRIDAHDTGSAGIRFEGFLDGKKVGQVVVDDTAAFYPWLFITQGTTGSVVILNSIEIGPLDNFSDDGLH